MEATNLRDALAMIMETHGWNQFQLGRELGMSQAYVSRLINGNRDLSIGKAIRYLARVGWEVRITPKAEGDAPVERREFVAATASAVLVPGAGASPYRDRAYVRSLVTWVARARYEHGGNSTLSAVMRHLHNVRPLLDSRDKGLQLAASDLACEAVWTLNDVRRHEAAENAGRVALELARRSGEVNAQSRAYSALSAISTSQGRSDRAIAYARHGLKLRGVDQAQHAWLGLRLAWAMSPLRAEKTNVVRTIDGVQEFWENAEGFGMSAFERSDMIGGMGTALRTAGAYPNALRSLSGAVEMTRGSSVLLSGYYLQQEILTILEIGDPAPAASKMSALAHTVPLVSSARIDDNLREILHRSAPWKDISEVRAAREQLQSVMASPAAHPG